VAARRRLIVIRHAKAEPFAATDHARELTDRGRTGAASTAAHLAGSVPEPDHAVVSSASRAQATWRTVCDVAGWDVPTSVDDSVYTGSADVTLGVLRSVPAEAHTVAYVGHNPTISYVSHLLDDGNGEPDAVSGMLRGFPPAAAAVFEVEVAWGDLGEGSGRIVDFFVP
jgi:phosphohistidine phosphatase